MSHDEFPDRITIHSDGNVFEIEGRCVGQASTDIIFTVCNDMRVEMHAYVFMRAAALPVVVTLTRYPSGRETAAILEVPEGFSPSGPFTESPVGLAWWRALDNEPALRKRWPRGEKPKGYRKKRAAKEA